MFFINLMGISPNNTNVQVYNYNVGHNYVKQVDHVNKKFAWKLVFLVTLVKLTCISSVLTLQACAYMYMYIKVPIDQAKHFAWKQVLAPGQYRGKGNSQGIPLSSNCSEWVHPHPGSIIISQPC